MAMMISKFHRLVQSKKVWGAFAVLISVAFIFAFNGGKGGGNNDNNQKKDVGELFGEKVPQAEFAEAYRDIELLYLLSGQGPISYTAETGPLIDREIWLRLAQMKKAEQMDLHVSDQQVLDRIQSLSFFLNEETGLFDESQYELFFSQYLANVGIRCDSDRFVKFIRHELTLSKLRNVIAQGAVVTESEVEERFHLENDEVTGAYVTLPKSLSPEVEVSREEAKSFFEENRTSFPSAETREFHYVVFPVEDYTNEVVLTEEQINGYYEAYKATDYMTVPEEPAEGEEDAEPSYIPLEVVRNDVISNMTHLVALNQEARKAASRFFNELGSGNQTLRQLAMTEGIPAKETATLTNIDPLAEINESEEVATYLTQRGFALRATRSTSIYDCYSDPIVLENGVYILECTQITPSELPETFEEVEERVFTVANQQATEEAYIEKAEEIQSAISDAITAGTSFSNAVVELELEPQVLGPFSRKTMPQTNSEYTIAQSMLKLDPGAISKLLLTDDNFAVAFTEEKLPVDISTADQEELTSINSMIRSDKIQRHLSAWQDKLMKEANLKDLREKE